jgi:hypothetical protein
MESEVCHAAPCSAVVRQWICFYVELITTHMTHSLFPFRAMHCSQVVRERQRVHDLGQRHMQVRYPLGNGGGVNSTNAPPFRLLES